MATVDHLRKLALSFPKATEEPHFEKVSFSVRKKIFVTWNERGNQASVKLSETDQGVFSSANPINIYPVNNKWGKKGWTIVKIDCIGAELFNAIITAAYVEVAPAKLARLVTPKFS